MRRANVPPLLIYFNEMTISIQRKKKKGENAVFGNKYLTNKLQETIIIISNKRKKYKTFKKSRKGSKHVTGMNQYRKEC